jgi:nitroreductase
VKPLENFILSEGYSMSELSLPTPTVLATISGRRSVRAFTNRPVPTDAITAILAAAARSPSANNTQPWRVHVLTGAAKDRLSAAILDERASGKPEPAMEYGYHPAEWPEPYLSLRREVGWALYGLLRISKGDRATARRWHDQNFTFFGAPVGMVMTVDRRLGLGSLIDIGMFLEALNIAARSFGLEACAQAAFGVYHAIVRRELRLTVEEKVICGLSLGFEDKEALPNQLRTSRVPVEKFAKFHSE